VTRENVLLGPRHAPHVAGAYARPCRTEFRSVGMDVVDVGMVDTCYTYFAINVTSTSSAHHYDRVAQTPSLIHASDQRPRPNRFFFRGSPRATPTLAHRDPTPPPTRWGSNGAMANYEQDLVDAYRAHVPSSSTSSGRVTVVVDASTDGRDMVPRCL